MLYQADSISLDLTELAQNSHDLVNVHGKVLFNHCEDLVQSQPVTFRSNDAFIEGPPWDASLGGTIQFQFRTNEANGLVLYSSGSVTDSDFFAFEILDGFLYLLLDQGSGLVKVKVAQSHVNDGLPHKVKLHHLGALGTVQIDDMAQEYHTLGANDQLDLAGPLYMGGVDPELHQGLIGGSTSTIPTQLWSAVLRYGFVGCLQEVTVNNIQLDVAGMAREQAREEVGEFCRVLEPMCPSRPCMHNGVCHEGWNRFICDCSATGFIGPTCNEGRTTDFLSFLLSPFLLYSHCLAMLNLKYGLWNVLVFIGFHQHASITWRIIDLVNWAQATTHIKLLISCDVF